MDDLRTVRERLRLTQREMAEKLGLSESYVRAIENFQRPMSRETTTRLSILAEPSIVAKVIAKEDAAHVARIAFLLRIANG